MCLNVLSERERERERERWIQSIIHLYSTVEMMSLCVSAERLVVILNIRCSDPLYMHVFTIASFVSKN